ncbi:hypothetical protein [Arthrobacter sp. CP30]
MHQQLTGAQGLPQLVHDHQVVAFLHQARVGEGLRGRDAGLTVGPAHCLHRGAERQLRFVDEGNIEVNGGVDLYFLGGVLAEHVAERAVLTEGVQAGQEVLEPTGSAVART